MCYRVDGSDLIINIKLFPNAQKNEIVGTRNSELIIKINAAPEGGKANKKTISFLAKEFKISKQSISIRSGELSRHKVVAVPYSDLIAKYLDNQKEM